jgi:hypothetical protein
MKKDFVLRFLSHSLWLGSLSSLLACSSVLRASQLSRSFVPQPAEIRTKVSPETVSETVSFMDEAGKPDYSAPYSMASGYRWVFIVRKSSRNTPGIGNWVVKPNNRP